MTAICGGGTSSPQPGVEDVIILGTNGLQILGLRPNLQWLSAIGIAGGAVLPITLSTLCATDPPANPSFTLAEVIAATTNQFQSPDYLSFTGKVRDLLLNIAWYKWCRCDVGSPSAAPAAPAAPAGYTVYDFTNPGFCLPMKASAVKVLNLWNGAANPAPPSGWDTEAFNDSAWATAQVATSTLTGGPPGVPTSGFTATGTIQAVKDPCPSPSDPIAPWVTPATGKEAFVFRWHFDLPQFNYGDIYVSQSSGFQSGGGWTSGSIRINDAPSSAIFNNATGWGQQINRLRVGRNLIAGYVNSANFSANTWGTQGWISEFIGGAGQALPYQAGATCCPTDPAILSMLQRIQDQVDLVQRQLAPFSYVPGATHTGITGTGEIAVQGLLGVAVDVTTQPTRVGIRTGTPDTLYDAGWITLGTADGWVHERRVRSDPFIWLPYGASAMTRLGYTITPGVTVTLKELEREP